MGKRILSAIAAITTAALLSSCAPATSQAPETDADVASTTQAELPPGFYLGEEFIEIGEFNPNKVELIDLCEEIPDEVLLEAGMINTGSDSRFNPESIICIHEEDGKEKGLFGLISDRVSKENLASENLVRNTSSNSFLQEAFLYSFPSDEASCFAAVETSRGLVSVVYDNPFVDTSQEKLCDRALEALEAIYIQLRGK